MSSSARIADRGGVQRRASADSWIPALPQIPFAPGRAVSAVCLLVLALAQVIAQVTPKNRRQVEAATAIPSATYAWWKHAVIYEIYPRSFADSNGDGIGDLKGITEHLDYLQSLGVDAIWIAPMYPSPQVDFGYDISNFQAIDPTYGTLQDFDRLQAGACRHHIRIILDMVLNHTSYQHPWFVESAASRTNDKADWYVWHSGIPANTPGVTAFQKKFEHEGRVPPNNWESFFGGSAWEWVAARKQFYYHKFYRQQPDLNWRNPAVEAAMFDVMRFWLRRGVAGFRLDAIPTLFEDLELRNEPQLNGTNEQGDPNLKEVYTANLPELHGVLRRMRAMVDEYPGSRVLIGEIYTDDTASLSAWYGGATQDELQLPMDTLVGFGGGASYSAPWFRSRLDEAENEIHGAQPLLVFDNHDNARSLDRFGDGVQDVAIARGLATVLYTARATAMTYYGAQIGMKTMTPTRKEDVKDPIGITGWPREKGRDGERTPMQWTAGPSAGFSSNPRTWLPVAPNFRTVNVATESRDPLSLLNWNKRVIALRHSIPALRDGGMVMVDAGDPHVLAFLRTAPRGHPCVLVAVNMSAQPRTVSFDLQIPSLYGAAVHTLAASDPSMQTVSALQAVTLPPYASWIASVP